MLMRLLQAICIAIAVGIGLLFLGLVIGTIKAPIAVTVGDFLKVWGWGIGILVGIWSFASGQSWGPFNRSTPG